ncbi:MAG: hypothetical protein JXJ04_13630 [Spirochaetales bacterium]|nr:hypothetical protein [Spirochaetales bacterium]
MKNFSNSQRQSLKKTGRKYNVLIFLLCFLEMSLINCGAFQNPEQNTDIDLSPPVFKHLIPTSRETILLTFNEPTFISTSYITIKPDLAVTEIIESGNDVRLSVSSQTPGIEYTLTATCMDENENSLQFLVTFYGYNPDIPELIINEFITKGSSTHPDLMEIKVIEEGNMGGITCYQGTYSDWESRLIFPSFTVRKGDFILVHFKPLGTADEIDETDASDISGGLDASPEAYDFWVPGGSGISGNNGVLTIYDYPGGTIIDGVLYSNRTSGSDDTYMGFGSRKVMEQAGELESAGEWIPRGSKIRPEDGINPDNSTATRSLCRNRENADTNTNRDWHIVPTKKSSFGEENCEELYSK